MKGTRQLILWCIVACVGSNLRAAQVQAHVPPALEAQYTQLLQRIGAASQLDNALRSEVTDLIGRLVNFDAADKVTKLRKAVARFDMQEKQAALQAQQIGQKEQAVGETPAQQVDQGQPPAISESQLFTYYNLVRKYALEEGVPQDYAHAQEYRQYLERIARDIHVPPHLRGIASYLMGNIYFHGFGVRQSYVRARPYFEVVSDYYPAAAFAAGLMYWKGLGGAQNLRRARRYFRQAAQQTIDAPVRAQAQSYLQKISAQEEGEEARKNLELPNRLEAQNAPPLQQPVQQQPVMGVVRPEEQSTLSQLADVAAQARPVVAGKRPRLQPARQSPTMSDEAQSAKRSRRDME